MPDHNVRIRPTFAIIGHSPDVVELRTGIWNPVSFTLTDDSGKGKLFALISGLDGSLSRRELAKREGLSRADVEAVIDHLYALGVLEERPQSALDAYVEQVHLGAPPGALNRYATRVLLAGDPELDSLVEQQLGGFTDVAVDSLTPAHRERLDSLDAAAWDDGLDTQHVVDEFADWRGAFLVVAQTTINPPRMRSINRLCLAIGISWLYAAVDGPFVFVGPTVVPHRSACLECFETRVMSNLRESASYQRYKAALAKGAVLAGQPSVLKPTAGLLAAHAALEVLNFLATGSTTTIAKTLGIYLPTMEIGYNEVLPMPGCPACSPLAGRDDNSLYFDARAWVADEKPVAR